MVKAYTFSTISQTPHGQIPAQNPQAMHFASSASFSIFVFKGEKITPEIALWSEGRAYSSDVSTCLASAAIFIGRTFRYTESGELALPSTTSKSRSIEMPKWRSFVWRYG